MVSRVRIAGMSAAGWERWLSGIFGAASFGAGAVATFTRGNEAGPVALIAAGLLLTLIAVGGRLPTRIKVGDTEAEFIGRVGDFTEKVVEVVPAENRGRVVEAVDDLSDVAPQLAERISRTLVRDAIQEARFTIEQLTDLSGGRTEVLDLDAGFMLSGSVTLPSWLRGKGDVQLAADEIGGQFDQTIGQAIVNVGGAMSPDDPPFVTYNWAITVGSPVMPGRDALYRLATSFRFETADGEPTDIVAFYDLGVYRVE
jgi:hypothetical protein